MVATRPRDDGEAAQQGDERARRTLTLADALLPVALAVLILAATWKLTLGGRIIARGDLLLYFYPLRDFASQAVREGRLPLWNPYTFMGAPFLANSQVGFFYPFNLVTAWLPVEVAVSWNIALHLTIAALGTYALARLGMGLARSASFAAGLAFGLGGYLGAQVEHLNQVQVLAWLPWGILLVSRAWQGEAGRALLGLTPIIALQILAGHTQSLYISLLALTLTAVGQWLQMLRLARPPNAIAMARAAWPALALLASATLAALICAVQLLPTLELSGASARAGGLPFNEAGSFSWRPWVIARALMPTYGDPLFPEYVAYLGAAGLALATLGLITYRRLSGWPIFPLILLIAGFVLALGVATPLFSVLYHFLPGFNLFRAQARWLVLFALGGALLIGIGMQKLEDGLSAGQAQTWLFAWLGAMSLWTLGVLIGARASPEAEYRALPAQHVLFGWAAAIGGVTLLIGGVRRLPSFIFPLALVAELLIASQFQPYARAADRQALTSLQPATAHLLAARSVGTMAGAAADGRILALSSLVFDPGDKAEQEMIYGSQLSADELYDRLIATKHREILSPNLPLYYRLPSVDGYDGGLLPTRRYVEFVRQFADMPTGAVDGRLREFLTGVPAADWLERMAVRYLIADKTQDVFFDGVYYDLLFSVPVSPTGVDVPLRSFASTALGLVLSAEGAPAGSAVASAELTFDDGSAQAFTVRSGESPSPYFNARLAWQGRKTPLRLRLHAATDVPVTLRGLSSIDETDGTFLPQMIVADVRLAHSGDVKIYERVGPVQRAVVRLDDGAMVGLEEVGGAILDDRPEFVRIVLASGSRARALILRDACFPGWVAQVDGVEAPVACEEVLFRSVELPAGAREVTFSYRPLWPRVGAALSAAGVAVWLLLIVARWRAGRRARGRPRRPAGVASDDRSLLHTRIERIAQTIAQEGERDHQQRDHCGHREQRPGWLPTIE